MKKLYPFVLILMAAMACNEEVEQLTSEEPRTKESPQNWDMNAPEDLLENTLLLYQNRFEIPNDVVPGEWKELGPFTIPEGNFVNQIGIGRVNSLSFNHGNSQLLYVCSPTGGMYYSEDYGETWNNGGTDFLPTSGAAWLLPDPRVPERWVLATGDGDGEWTPSAGIFTTTDKGKTWKDISEGLPVVIESWKALQISKIASHPKNLRKVYAATNKGLFVCEDVWANNPKWELAWKGQFNDVEFKPTKPTEIWAAGEVVVRSTDAGGSWNIVPGTGFTKIGYEKIKTNIEMTKADLNVVYVAVTGIDPKKGTYKAQLYRYDDRQKAWKDQGKIKDTSYLPYGLIPGRDKAFAVSPNDPNLLIVGNVNPMFRSFDGGITWTKLSDRVHSDIHHIRWSDDGQTLWATTDGGVHRSKDGGVTWEDVSEGIGVCNVLGMSISRNSDEKVVIGTYDCGSSILDKPTGKWQWKTGGDGYGNIIDPRTDDRFYTTAVGGAVWRHGKEGKYTVGAPASGSDWQTWIDYNADNPDMIYQCGKGIWRSANKGNKGTWENILPIKEHFPGYKKAIRLYPAPTDGNVMYAVLIGSYPLKLIKTNNAMAPAAEVKWEEMEHPENAWIIDMAISNTDPNSFWLAYSKVGDGFVNKVWGYNGEKWSNMRYDLPDFVAITGLAYEHDSKGKVYLGTNAGVFFTDERCKQWYHLTGLPHCHARLLKIDQERNFLVAGTFGRGVWQCRLPKEIEQK